MTAPEQFPGPELEFEVISAGPPAAPSGAMSETLAAGAEPSAASPRRRIWRVIAVAVALVLAVTGAGVATWLHRKENLTSIRATQQAAYRVAQSNLGAAQCATATPFLRLAAGSQAVPSLRARARRDVQDCADYERVLQRAAGRPRDALIAYVDFLAQPRTEGLASSVRTAARELLVRAPASAFTPEVCAKLGQLRTTKILEARGLDSSAPRVYGACLALWDRLRLTKSVAEGLALIRGELTAVRADRTVPVEPVARLRPPPGAAGPLVGLVVTNTRLAHVEVTVVGLTTDTAVTLVMPPCNDRTCTAGHGLACKSDAVQVLYAKPGRYAILTRSLPAETGVVRPDALTRSVTLTSSRGYLSCLE